jgi:hypothetical protein
MSLPMQGYAERDNSSCPSCGGHPSDCSCYFAGDDLIECGGPDNVWCETCHRMTAHLEFCDEHGGNKCLACTVCRRVARFY